MDGRRREKRFLSCFFFITSCQTGKRTPSMDGEKKVVDTKMQTHFPRLSVCESVRECQWRKERVRRIEEKDLGLRSEDDAS